MAMYESGLEAFTGILREWETRIALCQEARHALEGLDDELRKQLAALLLDIHCDFEEYGSGKAKFPKRRKLGLQAASRHRMVERKLAKIRAALGDLRSYVADLDRSHGLGYLCDIADAHLKRLPAHVEPPTVGPLGWMLTDDTVEPWDSKRNDPTTAGMVRVYWFFRNGCNLSGDESEVRTALIGQCVLDGVRQCGGASLGSFRIAAFHGRARRRRPAGTASHRRRPDRPGRRAPALWHRRHLARAAHRMVGPGANASACLRASAMAMFFCLVRLVLLDLPRHRLAIAHVAFERRFVAVEEHDHERRPAGIKSLGDVQQDALVAVGLVLPIGAAADRGVTVPLTVGNVEGPKRLFTGTSAIGGVVVLG